MIKTILLKIPLILSVFLPLFVESQDLIFLKNIKDTIKCKILEDKITYLRYRYYNSTDTTVYQVSQSQYDYYVVQVPLSSGKTKSNITPLPYNPKLNNTQKDSLEYKKNPPEKYFCKWNLGFGFGLDYGGFGLRVTFSPIKYVAVFGCFGYNLLEIGYNAGATFRLLPQKSLCPYINAFYGYNSVISIKGTNEYNKTYYGPSFGIGLEARSRSFQNHFNIELIIPVRSEEFYESIDKIKKNPNIKLYNDVLPVAISVGYHFGFK